MEADYPGRCPGDGDRMSQSQESPQSLRPSLEQTNLSIGDQVITPTGREGVIIPPKFDMPQHHLIEFEGGAVLWMLKEILHLAPVAPIKKRKKTG